MIHPAGAHRVSAYLDARESETAEGESPDAGPSVTGLTINGGAHSTASSSQVVFLGDVENVTISGDGGDQRVDVFGGFSGTVNGGGGNDAFIAHDGSTVTGSIHGQGGNDLVQQNAGATFRDVDIHTGDQADRLVFAGHNENVTFDPGDNEEIPDEIVLYDTITGDLLGSDNQRWKYKPKDESSWGRDVVKLVGDGFREGENGYELVGADGGISATFEIDGDEDHFETVVKIDPETGEVIDELKALDPEIVYDSMWAKWGGTVLKVAGGIVAVASGFTLTPVAAALIAGGTALDTYHQVDNNIDTWQTWGSLASSFVPVVGSAGTYLMGAYNVTTAAVNGDEAGILLGASGFFAPNSGIGRGLNTVGYSVRAYEAADAGEWSDALLYGTQAGINGGVITPNGDWHRGLVASAHFYDAGDLALDGDFGGAFGQFARGGVTSGLFAEGSGWHDGLLFAGHAHDAGAAGVRGDWGAAIGSSGEAFGTLGFDRDRNVRATTTLLAGGTTAVQYGVVNGGDAIHFVTGVSEFLIPRLEPAIGDYGYDAPPREVTLPEGIVAPSREIGTWAEPHGEAYAAFLETPEGEEYLAYRQDLLNWEAETIDKFTEGDGDALFFDQEGFERYVRGSDLSDADTNLFVASTLKGVVGGYAKRSVEAHTTDGVLDYEAFSADLDGRGFSEGTLEQIRADVFSRHASDANTENGVLDFESFSADVEAQGFDAATSEVIRTNTYTRYAVGRNTVNGTLDIDGFTADLDRAGFDDDTRDGILVDVYAGHSLQKHGASGGFDARGFDADLEASGFDAGTREAIRERTQEYLDALEERTSSISPPPEVSATPPVEEESSFGSSWNIGSLETGGEIEILAPPEGSVPFGGTTEAPLLFDYGER